MAEFDVDLPVAPSAPRISGLQWAWLVELGLDRRMLAPFLEPTSAAAEPSAAAAVAPAPLVAAANAEAGPARAEAPPTRPLAAAQEGSRPMVDIAPRPRPAATAEPDPMPDRAPSAPLPDDWQALAERVEVCQSCSLHAGRSMVVYGNGHVDAPEWMIIGEAPGDQDDRMGLAFQGRPGVLLQAMLRAVGLDLDRTPVFYTNLVKCRPLGNRTPSAEEVAACQPFLQRQIALLRPRRILVLGRLAAQALTGSKEFDAMRGGRHDFKDEQGRSIPLVVLHHPASMLSRPQQKAETWHDLVTAVLPLLRDRA